MISFAKYCAEYWKMQKKSLKKYLKLYNSRKMDPINEGKN